MRVTQLASATPESYAVSTSNPASSSGYGNSQGQLIAEYTGSFSNTQGFITPIYDSGPADGRDIRLLLSSTVKYASTAYGIDTLFCSNEEWKRKQGGTSLVSLTSQMQAPQGLVGPCQKSFYNGGHNLGSTFTHDNQLAIYSGGFQNIYVGDYWNNGNYAYIVADMDYFPAMNQHHLVMIAVPKKSYRTSCSFGTTETYYQSPLRTSTVANLGTTYKFTSFFGTNYIASLNLIYPSGWNGNLNSTAVWASTKCDLLTAEMIGAQSNVQLWTEVGSNGVNVETQPGWAYYCEYTKLALFQQFPYAINTIATGFENVDEFWLKNTVRSGIGMVYNPYSGFRVAGYGDTHYLIPYFVVTGATGGKM